MREACFAGAIVAAGVVLGCWFVHVAHQHQSDPLPRCSAYADTRRDITPSRCFSDFHPETP